MLKLDGSKLEGGGQLTRMALCLSAITGKAVKIYSIRAGRGSKSAAFKQRDSQGKDKRSNRGQKGSQNQRADTSSAGGLKESHLAALHWLAVQTYADVDGAEVGSTEVVFKPGVLKGKYGPGLPQRPNDGSLQYPIRDAIQLNNPGSIWLIFQAIYPYMVFAPRANQCEAKSTQDDQTNEQVLADDGQQHHEDLVLYDLTLIGGTNVPKSMSTEYVQQVFLPTCEKIGLPRVHIQTIKSGWTTGKLEVGKVNVKMYAPDPSSLNSSGTFKLPAFTLTERGSITKISITIVSTPPLFPTLTDLLTSTISSHPTFKSLNEQPSIEVHSTQDSGHERRLYILLVAHTSSGDRLGRDFLGNGGKPKNVREEENLLVMSVRCVVDALMREIEGGACVDKFMQDQIVTFQALADGMSEVRGRDDAERVEQGNGPGHGPADLDTEESADRGGSLHTRTVRWVCEEIVDGVKFEPGGVCRKLEEA